VLGGAGGRSPARAPLTLPPRGSLACISYEAKTCGSDVFQVVLAHHLAKQGANQSSFACPAVLDVLFSEFWML
jgi:hypothetical protein